MLFAQTISQTVMSGVKRAIVTKDCGDQFISFKWTCIKKAHKLNNYAFTFITATTINKLSIETHLNFIEFRKQLSP